MCLFCIVWLGFSFFFFFLLVSLVWFIAYVYIKGLKAPNKEEKYKFISDCKIETTVETLTKDLPEEFGYGSLAIVYFVATILETHDLVF
jgi:hypothetical protein